MLLLIDNYDSFTYNLVHYLGELGAEVTIYRNDAISADEGLALKPEGIVLSPGPCDPDQAGICLELIEKNGGAIPLMGVCLGHQAIGQAFGGKVVRAKSLMHGKTSAIHHQGHGLFEGLPTPFTATRYHSLTVEADSLPECLEVTAQTDDGVVMGLSHRDYPVHGVQFHPESIASDQGHELLKNFLSLVNGSGAA
jgi:anthranilate synthase component 2